MVLGKAFLSFSKLLFFLLIELSPPIEYYELILLNLLPYEPTDSYFSDDAAIPSFSLIVLVSLIWFLYVSSPISPAVVEVELTFENLDEL